MPSVKKENVQNTETFTSQHITMEPNVRVAK